MINIFMNPNYWVLKMVMTKKTRESVKLGRKSKEKVGDVSTTWTDQSNARD